MTKKAAPRKKSGADKRIVSAATIETAAQTRSDAVKVRSYLETISSAKRRGRKRTPDSIKRRIEAIDAELAEAGQIQRVQLIQERLDLSDELKKLQSAGRSEETEAAFVAVAKRWGEAKGISYGAWREFGVSPATLKAAGISRSE